MKLVAFVETPVVLRSGVGDDDSDKDRHITLNVRPIYSHPCTTVRLQRDLIRKECIPKYAKVKRLHFWELPIQGSLSAVVFLFAWRF